MAVALRYAADQAQHGQSLTLASTNGYAVAFRIGAVILSVGCVLVTLLLEHVQSAPAQTAVALEAEPVLMTARAQ